MTISNKRLASLPTLVSLSLLFGASTLLFACGPKASGKKKDKDDSSEEDDKSTTKAEESSKTDKSATGGTNSTASGKPSGSGTGSMGDSKGKSGTTMSPGSSATGGTGTGTGTGMPKPKAKETGDDKISLTWFETGYKGTIIGSHATSATDVWLSGTSNTVLHSTDGGMNWTSMKVASAEGDKALQFRDIEVVDANTVYVMSSGVVEPGKAEPSRIYKTTNKGMNWSEQYKSTVAGSFFDCFDFWDANNGILFGDSVGKTMYILRTSDGSTWERLDPNTLPAPVDKEGAFAASGTCTVARGPSTVWIGTGAGSRPRILKSTDKGATWDVVDAPLVGGTDASGVSSLVFWSDTEGMAFGVDLTAGLTGIVDKTVAYTKDGGKTWELRKPPAQAPGIFGAAANSDGSLVVAVGTAGMHYSQDKGLSWKKLSDHNFWTVSFGDDKTAYAGGQFNVVKLTVK